ncbi:MAG TPA: T9SS type A sorting domain-containing protein, partial [Flavobacteriales bacterium]|nr:T9SS type A sorting domain-containing protein [Flavobacteriales bacterium]
TQAPVASGLRVHPNPATGTVLLTGASVVSGLRTITVVDGAGRTVQRSSPTSMDRSGAVTLDLSALAPGPYRVILVGSNGTASATVIKE